MSIRVENLSKSYGQQKALDQVSFEIPKGQIVGLLGPNGAGKSTLMKILTSYLPQSEGKAWVCGMDTQDNSLKVRQLIGYLPEHNPLYPDMVVTEFLRFVAKLHKLDKSKVTDVIRKVGLEPEQHKKIEALSKGYRQRVGLAAALMHDPDVLILDEPTTGLDPNQLTAIRELIMAIGKDKTVILSTHVMQEVEAMCDRVIFIKAGKIQRDDSVENITKSSSMEEAFRLATAD